MKDILECYKTLGIEPGAAPERVRNAYLQLARFYDPERFVSADAEQVAKAELKRKEVEEAYSEIRRFLPALARDPQPEEKSDQDRDFNEMVDKGPKEVSKLLVGIILGIVMILVIGWGYYLYKKTQHLPPSSMPIVDPENVSSPGPDNRPSTGSARSPSVE